MIRSWDEKETYMLTTIRCAVGLSQQGVEPETAHNLSVLAVKMMNYLQTERERAYYKENSDVHDKLCELKGLKHIHKWEKQNES